MRVPGVYTRRSWFGDAWDSLTTGFDNIMGGGNGGSGTDTTATSDSQTAGDGEAEGATPTVAQSPTPAVDATDLPDSIDQQTVSPDAVQTLLTAESTPTPSAVTQDSSASDDALPDSMGPTSVTLLPTLAVAPTTALHTATATALPTATTDSTAAAAAAAAAAKDNDSDTSGKVGGAAKAGIAIGVLAVVLVVFMALYLLFTRRRKQMEHQRLAREHDDEKLTGTSAVAVRSMPNNNGASEPRAPRLSLRPLTQLWSSMGSQQPQQHQQQYPDRRASRGAAAMLNTQKALPSPGPMDRPATNSGNWPDNPFSNDAAPANPFGNHAERIPEPVSPVGHRASAVGVAQTTNDPPPSPMSDHRASVGSAAVAAGAAAVAAGAAAVAAGAAVVGVNNMTRKASLRKPVAGGQDPAFAQNQNAAPAAASAGAGGPPPPPPAVHRVQLDFNPTMPDEMELRPGQLVRLLHEYDDGWAFCVRLDRSQQGVVPRTCLSTRPVKPRPPPNVNPRGGPPVSMQRVPGQHPPQHQQPGPYGRPPQGQQQPRQQGSRPQSPATGHGGVSVSGGGGDPRYQPQPQRPGSAGAPAGQAY